MSNNYEGLKGERKDMAYMAGGYRVTKCDFVTEQLKEMIITGVYKTGEKLPNESTLCEQFNVSRITVREALKKLNMMGILDIRQGKGTFVKQVDLGLFMKPLYQLIDFEDVDIEAIYSAREYIENGTVSMAAEKRTKEELAEMEKILQGLRTAIASEDLLQVEYMDTSFHLQVAKSAKNPILYACLEAIEEINRTCLKRFSKYLTILDDCYEEHSRIYEAIRKQDVEEASKAMIAHTLSSKKVLL